MSFLQNRINNASANFQIFNTWENQQKDQAQSKINTAHARVSDWFEQNLSCIGAIQAYPDRMGNALISWFQPLNACNQWLEKPIEAPLLGRIVIALLKAPLFAIRNVLVLFYSIIKTVLQACVHPVDAMFDFGIFLIDLVHRLLQPENWSKIGMGMIGASVGQAIITGNPVSIVGASLGTVFVVLGLCMGPLKAALMVEEGQRLEAAKEKFIELAKELPEMFLTGFLLGIFLGGIQRAVYQPPTPNHHSGSFKQSTTHKTSFPYCDDVGNKQPCLLSDCYLLTQGEGIYICRG